MTSFETAQKWKPIIDQYQLSGARSKRAFCRQNQINYQSFLLVIRNIKKGLVSPPKVQTGKPKSPPGRPDPAARIEFARVVIRKEGFQ